MPPYRVLYYPDFTPDSRWLRQILLLTDDVTRIVPSDVDPEDSEDLLRLQDAIPGCLRRMAPGKSDVAIEREDGERLDRVFRQLSRRLRRRPKRITVEISPSGGISVAGHVFIHDSKVSEFVLELLTAHGLVEPFGNEISSGRFILVRKEASEVILAGVASRMARRIGIDTITDRSAPFAFGASRDLPSRTVNHGDVEGALLSALATLIHGAKAPIISYPHVRDDDAAENWGRLFYRRRLIWLGLCLAGRGAGSSACGRFRPLSHGGGNLR